MDDGTKRFTLSRVLLWMLLLRRSSYDNIKIREVNCSRRKELCNCVWHERSFFPSSIETAQHNNKKLKFHNQVLCTVELLLCASLDINVKIH